MKPGLPNLSRVGDFSLVWGESLRWDDRRQRLYFVDCASNTLYWLEDLTEPPTSLALPSMPTGVVLTDTGQLVVCLDRGLHVIDPDAGSWEILAPYPDEMHGRANDANADRAGNLVTGTLNLGPGAGGAWWFSADEGWRLLDRDISNTNGPLVIEIDGEPTLILADTPARAVYAYPYDGRAGTVGHRRLFGDHAPLGGSPDGATSDSESGVWSCSIGAGMIARFDAAGLDRTLETPMRHPSDAGFGGPDLDRLFVAGIAVDLGDDPPAPEDGWLMVADQLGATGSPEARFHLA